MFQLTAADGHGLSAYRAEPNDDAKGAVVLIHDMFGITDDVRAAADDFAARGYLAIVPALFDRAAPDTVLAYDEEGFAKGVTLVEEVGREPALNDIQAAVDAAREAGKVAVVGYSWGGFLAYEAANQLRGLACAIAYYPLGVVGAGAEKRRVPTLIHFGATDPLVPVDQAQRFRDQRPDVSAFTYEGATHGFASAGRATYHAAATCEAQARTQFWIGQFVEGQAPVQLKNAGAYAQAKTEKKKAKAPAGDDLGPPLD